MGTPTKLDEIDGINFIIKRADIYRGPSTFLNI